MRAPTPAWLPASRRGQHALPVKQTSPLPAADRTSGSVLCTKALIEALTGRVCVPSYGRVVRWSQMWCGRENSSAVNGGLEATDASRLCASCWLLRVFIPPCVSSVVYQRSCSRRCGGVVRPSVTRHSTTFTTSTTAEKFSHSISPNLEQISSPLTSYIHTFSRGLQGLKGTSARPRPDHDQTGRRTELIVCVWGPAWPSARSSFACSCRR